ncbi:MAG: Maf family nucleotide pyrophosphatase, partial [Caldilineaceae bacterium]
MNPLKVILASASPRRRQFVAGLGIDVATAAADIDETPLPGEGAKALARRLALAKARAVAADSSMTQHHALVIGADTVVALDGTLLGKPADVQEAAAMLAALAGRVHQVHSALALVHVDGDEQTHRVVLNTTHVTMRDYSAAEIDAYVATGDSLDKAGAYAIQHRGFEPVARVDGRPAGV